MAMQRKWPILTVCLIVTLILIERLSLQWRSGPLGKVQSTAYTPDPRPLDNKFRWEDVSLRFPVPSYAPLPMSKTRLPKVQYAFQQEPKSAMTLRHYRQQEVKKVLRRCWSAYRRHAWLFDELTPISGSSKDTFGGWAATLVDTLDTLWIAGLKDEFDDGVEALLEIDFNTIPQGETNVFETTIRFLGGFISAYDLSGDRRLLDKAIEVAEMLYHAFDTPNRMPITRWNARDTAEGKTQFASEEVLVAEIGSLSLEFTRLSQITRDDKWYDCIDRIMQVFERQQASSNIPGMWPLVVNARTQDFASGAHFTLAAMADSVYEYLLKMYALLGGSKVYAKMYEYAMNPAVEHTIFRPTVPDNPDILVAGSAYSGDHHEVPQSAFQGQHLVCFAGGMLALGGQLLQNKTHVDLGRKLTDGCIWTYEATPLGIMPEVFDMLPCERGLACVWNESKWHAAVLEKTGQSDSNVNASAVVERERLPPGFTSMPDRRYMLRPEAIESVFVLYRITGDTRLQDKAWNMFTNISKYTETEFTNAALRDVTDVSAPKEDSMESFWTAETLKYFYLIFSEPDLISLDEFVFNTEAHPFRRP